MSTKPTLKLSLLENSHAFLEEAVAKAITAEDDIRNWQFAILNVVQALELSLKAVLKEVHPVLIYENIDRPGTDEKPGNTVSTIQAMGRLRHPSIGMVFSEQDERRIERAVKVRNNMTHADFELSPEYAAATFFELFALVAEFQRAHLETKISDVIPFEAFSELLKIEKQFQELVRRALERIADEKIPADEVWYCPDCGANAFVIADGADTCYVCTFGQEVVSCPQCSNPFFEHELAWFADDLETTEDEGRTRIVNDYGYDEHVACPDCIDHIRADIREKRERLDWLEEEYSRK